MVILIEELTLQLDCLGAGRKSNPSVLVLVICLSSLVLRTR